MAVLVYTKCWLTRKAINLQHTEYCNVFFFDNKIQLLVCAKIMDDACVIIDMAQGNVENSYWLLSRLESHAKIYIIAPKKLSLHCKLRSAKKLRDIVAISKICKEFESNKRYDNISECLYSVLRKKITAKQLRFLISYYNSASKSISPEARKNYNTLNYIKLKLSLDCSIETKNLILLLNQASKNAGDGSRGVS